MSDIVKLIDSRKETVLVTHPETKRVYKITIVPSNESEKRYINEWLGPITTYCPKCGATL